MERAAVCNKFIFRILKISLLYWPHHHLTIPMFWYFWWKTSVVNHIRTTCLYIISCNCLEVFNLVFKYLFYYNWKVLSITLLLRVVVLLQRKQPFWSTFHIVCVRPSHWLEFIEFAFIIMSRLMLSLVAGQFL